MRRPWRLLALLPAMGLLGVTPFVNRVTPFVLGVPLLLAWIVGCVLLTALVMALIGRLDRAADAREGVAPERADEPAAPGAPTTPAVPPSPPAP